MPHILRFRRVRLGILRLAFERVLWDSKEDVMKFSENSLKKLIKGACYFEINRGYLTAFRFSKKQIDLTKRDGYNQSRRDRIALRRPIFFKLEIY